MEMLENIEKNIDKGLDILDKNLSTLQTNFMESNLYGIVDTGINLGIKVLLPDIIEDQVIDIKDSIMENGLKEGVKEAVNTIKEFGKSILGLATGNFENISQIQTATKSGGVIDTISKFLDNAIDKAKDTGKISNNTKNILKSEKNVLLKNIKADISENVDNQVKYVDKINVYNNKWQEAYDNQDLSSMKKALNNIKKYLEKITPLENILKQARKIETIHNLVENTRKF